MTNNSAMARHTLTWEESALGDDLRLTLRTRVSLLADMRRPQALVRPDTDRRGRA